MPFLQELLNAAQALAAESIAYVDTALAGRLVVDLAATYVLVRFIYYRHYRRSDLFLTFFSFNLVIFLVTYLMNESDMKLGAAFGLFAVFSMLRYRTEGISTKDMTYLFMSIAVGLIVAVSTGGWPTLVLTVTAVLLLVQVLESGLIIKREYAQDILYENAALVSPANRTQLIRDLVERTGLNIHRVDMKEIDFVKDITRLTVYYSEEEGGCDHATLPGDRNLDVGHASVVGGPRSGESFGSHGSAGMGRI